MASIDKRRGYHIYIAETGRVSRRSVPGIQCCLPPPTFGRDPNRKSEDQDPAPHQRRTRHSQRFALPTDDHSRGPRIHSSPRGLLPASTILPAAGSCNNWHRRFPFSLMGALHRLLCACACPGFLRRRCGRGAACEPASLADHDRRSAPARSAASVANRPRRPPATSIRSADSVSKLVFDIRRILRQAQTYRWLPATTKTPPPGNRVAQGLLPRQDVAGRCANSALHPRRRFCVMGWTAAKSTLLSMAFSRPPRSSPWVLGMPL